MARLTPKRAAVGCVSLLAVAAAVQVLTPLLARRFVREDAPVPLSEATALARVDVAGKSVALLRLRDDPWREGGDPNADNDRFNNVSLDNPASLVYVDHDGDGRLTPVEGRPYNLPYRIGDTMFDLAWAGESGLKATPAKGPLQGIVVGASCPPFDYGSTRNVRVTDTALRGKPAVIQVFSATCEASVLHLADMARWRRRWKGRIGLFTLSVDRSYAADDAARAAIDRALQREGVDWPVALEPTGWNGMARRFNLYHFGFTVLDAAGNVRGANLLPAQAEALLERLAP